MDIHFAKTVSEFIFYGLLTVVIGALISTAYVSTATIKSKEAVAETMIENDPVTPATVESAEKLLNKGEGK